MQIKFSVLFRASFVGLCLAALQAQLQADDPSSQLSPTKPLKRLKEVSAALNKQTKSLYDQAIDCDRRGYVDEAEHHWKELLALTSNDLGDEHYLTHQAKSSLDWHHWYVSLSDNQREIYWREFDKQNDSDNFFAGGDFKRALDLHSEMESTFDRLKAPPSVDLAILQMDYACLLDYFNRPDDALAHANRALKIACEAQGEVSPTTGQALSTIGIVYYSSGQLWQSTRAFSRACRIYAACGDELSDDYVKAISHSAMIFLSIEDYEKAEFCLGEGEQLSKLPIYGAENVSFEVAVKQCWLSMEKNNLQEALGRADKLVELEKKLYGTEHHLCVDVQLVKGEVLLKLGQLEAADPLITNAYFNKSTDQRPPMLDPDYKTEAYVSLLIAKQKQAEAIRVLESEIADKEKRNDWGLRLPLKLYAKALRGIAREDDAKAAEARVAKMEALLKEARRQIDNDPECKFPWEDPLAGLEVSGSTLER